MCAMAGEALRDLKPRFSTMYATTRRPPIAPEKSLRTRLLQVPYPVRSGAEIAWQFASSVLSHRTYLSNSCLRGLASAESGINLNGAPSGEFVTALLVQSELHATRVRDEWPRPEGRRIAIFISYF
jgi:hypothetical protein